MKTMSLIFALKLFLLLLSLFKNISSQNIEVTIPLGRILGSTLITRLGKPLYAFRGIRYAKPPLDDLRFQPPVAVEPWSGIYNATEDGPVCPQPTKNLVSEDCLFLNIYTTKLPSGEDNPDRSVIVHLHAGGLYEGSGRSDSLGPQYFMDQDIVLVTLNYRLGSLGFISVGKEAPGNNGFKDQVMALKWVQNNIKIFGGDPNSVTLFGYSAGAWSVNLHMVSPMSRGLFHKAIASSGLAVGNFILSENQLDKAKKQAIVVGCPDNNASAILECLKTKPAEELGNSFPKLLEFGKDPILTFLPVIEEEFGQERFLTDQPLNLINNGNFKKIPMLVGITEDELAAKAFYLLSESALLKQLNDNFGKFAPIAFTYERDSKSEEISKNLQTFYFNDEPLTNASLENLVKLYSDSIIGFPVDRYVSLLSEKNTEPIYYYEFTYKSNYSHFYTPGTNEPYGVVHQDDLMYLFYRSSLFPYFKSNYRESAMVEKLTAMWAKFAKTSYPIDSKNMNTIKWKPYDIIKRSYLDIGEQLTLKANLFENRYSLWRKLYQ